MTSSRTSGFKQLEHEEVPEMGTEQGPVRRGRRTRLACRIRCKCSMETTHNLVMVKLGIKVMKLVESLNFVIKL